MKIKIASVCLLTVIMTACGFLTGASNGRGTENSITPTATNGAQSSAVPEPTPKAVGAADRKNLLAIGNGAFVVDRSSEAALNWVAVNIIDELSTAGWAAAKRTVSNQSLVIELPGRTTLKTLSFDTASVDVSQSAAKDVVVEISDTSATEGFKEILAATLKDAQDGQEFAVKQPVAGRWLRLKVLNNHGATDYLEIMDMRGYGEQEPLPPLANVSGTYESRFGQFHIKQDGTSLVGCYDANEGVIRGGLDGRVMTLEWKDKAGEGPAVMVFSADGTRFVGAYGRDTIANGFYGEWSGKKISDKVGGCAHLPTFESGKAAENQIGKELTDTGRAVIYGINFDFNSDVIKAESKSTLDQIAAVLLENKAWKMTVEGHTDNIGGDVFNKTLSEKRASAVKAYLVGKSIDGGRLSSSGLGMSKPVAPNETEAGRAQNRRVELVKN